MTKSEIFIYNLLSSYESVTRQSLKTGKITKCEFERRMSKARDNAIKLSRS